MDERRLQYFKKRLEELRDTERTSAHNLKRGLQSGQNYFTGELSSYDNHPADIGDVLFEREKDLGLKIFAENKLALIEEALTNVENGNYGLCRVCGKEIDPGRLQVIPYTPFCQDCKREYDSIQGIEY